MEFLIECMDDLSVEQQKVRASFSSIFYVILHFYYNLIPASFPVPILLSKPNTSASSAAIMASEEKVDGGLIFYCLFSLLSIYDVCVLF